MKKTFERERKEEKKCQNDEIRLFVMENGGKERVREEENGNGGKIK